MDELHQAGWVHPHDVTKGYHGQMRVYQTEKVANRYNPRKDSIPVYVKTNDIKEV